MKTVLYVFALIAAAALMLWFAGVLPGMPARQHHAGTCTTADPCKIHFAFPVTESGAQHMPPGLLQRVARDDLKMFRRALRTSGALDGRPGRPNIQIDQPVILDQPIDAGQADRVDAPAGWNDPIAFNQRMLHWLPQADRLKATARKVNIVVVFTGLRGPDGACHADALAGDGYLLIPGCLLDGYADNPRAALDQRTRFLGDVLRLFGGAENASVDPQMLSRDTVSKLKRAAPGVAARHPKVD